MRGVDSISGGADGGRDFPGANRINLNGSGPVLSGNRATFSAWALTDSGSSLYVIARWNGAPSTSSYAFGIMPVTVLIHDGAGQDSIAGTFQYPVGGAKLHHYAATKDGSQIRMYIDGKIDHHAASTRSMQNVGTPCLGDVALASPWNGVMKHACIWDETLTPWEIMQLAQGWCPYDVRGAKLRVWIPLTEWSGGTGTARDLSVFGQPATPAGGTTYAPRPSSAVPTPVDPLVKIIQDQPPLFFLGGQVISQVVSG